MPAYVFKGKTRTGAPASGERNAESKDAVIAAAKGGGKLASSQTFVDMYSNGRSIDGTMSPMPAK